MPRIYFASKSAVDKSNTVLDIVFHPAFYLALGFFLARAFDAIILIFSYVKIGEK